MTAVERWAEGLRALAIPEELLATAPGNPYAFGAGTFRVDTDVPPPDTPSRRAGLRDLPDGGTVLDVGCGGGAGGFGLRPVVGTVVGVDPRGSALEDLREAAAALGIAARTVEGRWPDAAREAGEADVVVCHHVVYNADEIVPFVRAMVAAARRRVVVELSAEHPWEWFRPLWLPLTGWDRPAAPTADDLVAVLGEMGIEPEVERWDRAHRFPDGRELAELLAGRLCLGPERVDDVAAAIERLDITPATATVTLTWVP